MPAIFATVLLIILEVVLLDPLVIAKYAGTLKLLLFATLSAAVIVMRESQLASYDPGFKVPLYPWVPLLGIALCITAIVLLGWIPVLFAAGMIVLSVLWFQLYAASKIDRYGAIYHVFARLGEHRFDPLDTELRGIIKDKGLRPDDPFEKTIARARVIAFLLRRSTHKACVHSFPARHTGRSGIVTAPSGPNRSASIL